GGVGGHRGPGDRRSVLEEGGQEPRAPVRIEPRRERLRAPGRAAQLRPASRQREPFGNDALVVGRYPGVERLQTEATPGGDLDAEEPVLAANAPATGVESEHEVPGETVPGLRPTS